MKRSVVNVGALIVCVIAVAVYLNTRTPAGLTTMGDDDDATIAWISLAAMISLLTALVGVVQTILELRAAKR